MTPLISVIVPVYNVEPYLHKCIDSILAQTYTNLEVLLVDDGSSDNSGRICDDYALQDKRIRVIHNEHGGVSSARNAGLNGVTGDYIGFVDSDDIINSEMYTVLYNTMQQTGTDISICRLIRFDLEENIEPRLDSTVHCFTSMEVLRSYFGNSKRHTLAVGLTNKLYKRCLFDGISFPIGLIHEDTFMTHQVLYKAKMVAEIESEMYYYRITPGSIMNAPFSERRLDMLKAVQEQIGFYEAKGLTELANLSRYFYAHFLISLYFMTSRNGDFQSCAPNLRKEFLDNYRNFMNNPTMSLHRRIGLWLFRYSPTAYTAAFGIIGWIDAMRKKNG